MGDQEVERTKLRSGHNVAYFRPSSNGVGPWEADEQDSAVDAVSMHRRKSAASASTSQRGASASASPTAQPDGAQSTRRTYSHWRRPAEPPKPKPPPPRAKHDTEGIDPLFLETESYTNRPGVGMVYDWRATHHQNRSISQEKQRMRRAEKVQEALQKELQVQQDSQRVFNGWLAMKQQERQWQVHETRQTLRKQTLPPLWNPPCEELVMREAGWSSSSPKGHTHIARAKVIKRPGRIANLHG